jgi:predicted aspartyl protease
MTTIRYRYNQQQQPPAPFVYVTVHTPDDTRASERCPALLDSGAAITVIPAEVAEQLSLLKYSEVALADWMDVTVTASAYWVNLTCHEMPINGVKVVAAQVSYLILGRDVLNQFHITLDGPNLALEIKVQGR